MTQEGLRRLRNTKLELGQECQRKHLNKFMLKLKISGYNEKFRREVTDSVLKAHVKMVEDDTNGVKPMYRSRDWNKNERDAAKSRKRFNWWNSEKSTIRYRSVLFVTRTPGAVLAKAEKQNLTEIQMKYSKLWRKGA